MDPGRAGGRPPRRAHLARRAGRHPRRRHGAGPRNRPGGLRRTRPPRAPPRPCSAGPRSRGRGRGGPGTASLGRFRGRSARDPRRRCRLPPARPRAPGRTAAGAARRRTPGTRPHGERRGGRGDRRASARARRPGHGRRADRAAGRTTRPARTGRRATPRAPRLPHSHLGLHRKTQGGAGAGPRPDHAAAPPALDDRRRHRSRRGPATAGGAHLLVRLRLRPGPGAVAAVRARTAPLRHRGDTGRRRAAGRLRPRPHRRRGHHALPGRAPDRRGTARRPAPTGVAGARRRGHATRVVAAGHRLRRHRAQHVRPDRGHRGQRERPTGGGRAGDRPPPRRHAGLFAGQRVASGTARRGGGAVPGRAAARARLPEPARGDGGAVRRRPVRRDGRGPDVPHRRSRPLGARQGLRVPRPGRRPGQDPRSPGGDR